MIRRIGITLIAILIVNTLIAQVLFVPKIKQEQSQWCWVGVSKCVLDYYNCSKSQCEIADYARTVIYWHDFGNESCCDNPGGPCNYWNYNYGQEGSIEDILEHFAGIRNSGTSNYLELHSIQNVISNLRPFIIRWGWKSGGGHFLVGHGILNHTLYYMDPWYGEGYKIATYEWVKQSSQHTWTHTNVLETSPNLQSDYLPEGPSYLCVNSENTEYKVDSISGAVSYAWSINPSDAGTISTEGTTAIVDWRDNFTGFAEIFVQAIAGEKIKKEGDHLLVNIINLPKKPLKPVGETIVQKKAEDNIYSCSEVLWADSYQWSIQPVEAGTLVEHRTNVTVNWSDNYNGKAYLGVCGISDCGIGESSELLEVEVQLCTGIEDQVMSSGIKIFPNPSNGRFSIQLGNLNSKALRIEIVNLFGQVIYCSKPRKEIEEIHLNVPDGAYLVKLIGEDFVKVEKLMIKHF